MHYAKINPYDIANGEGVRTSLFVSGCRTKCPGCFNKEAQRFNYGSEFTIDEFKTISGLLQQREVDGLSLLGGDPLWQDTFGMAIIHNLCKIAHEYGKTVWLWTGFVWEDIMTFAPNTAEGLWRQYIIEQCDVVVDGPFIEAEKDLSLAWRGSKNQRVIDVKKSLKKGEVVLYEGNA